MGLSIDTLNIIKEYKPPYANLKLVNLPQGMWEIQSKEGGYWLNGLGDPFGMKLKEVVNHRIKGAGEGVSYIFIRPTIDETIMQLIIGGVEKTDLLPISPGAHIYEGKRDPVVSITGKPNLNYEFTTNGRVFLADYLGLQLGMATDLGAEEVNYRTSFGDRYCYERVIAFVRPKDKQSGGDAMKIKVRVLQPIDNQVYTERTLQEILENIQLQPVTMLANSMLKITK